MSVRKRKCCRSSAVSPVFSWSRTSPSVLSAVEQKIFSSLEIQLKSQFVLINDGAQQIWTISLNEHSNRMPLVLLHGMGSGVALWVSNLTALSADRPLYAIDLLGFGRSSRFRFTDDPVIAEEEFVESIESWRKAVDLDKFILLGHSFGGFLATAYCLKYGTSGVVEHLILADAWGIPPVPSEQELNERMSGRLKFFVAIYKKINPFTPLRIAGPAGPWVMKKIRPELMAKFEPKVSSVDVANYIYHCNVQRPSGELAFKSISEFAGWARRPMIERVGLLPSDLTITMINGRESWINCKVAYQVQQLRQPSIVDVHIIDDSGHHVYADIPEEFNRIVTTACSKYESHSEPRVIPTRSVNDHEVESTVYR